MAIEHLWKSLSSPAIQAFCLSSLHAIALPSECCLLSIFEGSLLSHGGLFHGKQLEQDTITMDEINYNEEEKREE